MIKKLPPAASFMRRSRIFYYFFCFVVGILLSITAIFRRAGAFFVVKWSFFGGGARAGTCACSCLKNISWWCERSEHDHTDSVRRAKTARNIAKIVSARLNRFIVRRSKKNLSNFGVFFNRVFFYFPYSHCAVPA